MSPADRGRPGSVLSAALDRLVARCEAEASGGLAPVKWAEDEIKLAIGRHPEAASDLWHSFRLLMPTVASNAWGTEFVVRGHARELLDRIAARADTRPGTAAECALAMAAVAIEIPLHGAAAGLYWRMWRLAFPGQLAYADGGAHYEALERSAIDRHERYVRRRLAVPGRRLAALAVECDGEHWGQLVACTYATESGDRGTS
jgi:hypothetical protein